MKPVGPVLVSVSRVLLPTRTALARSAWKRAWKRLLIAFSLTVFMATPQWVWGLTNRITAVDLRESIGFPGQRLREFLVSFQGIVNS